VKVSTSSWDIRVDACRRIEPQPFEGKLGGTTIVGERYQSSAFQHARMGYGFKTGSAHDRPVE